MIIIPSFGHSLLSVINIFHFHFPSSNVIDRYWGSEIAVGGTESVNTQGLVTTDMFTASFTEILLKLLVLFGIWSVK